MRATNINSSVLIAGEDRDTGETTVLLFEMRGHRTHIARTGPEALGLADLFQPALILLDIALPGLNGFEVARMLRSARWSEEVSIVAMTGQTGATIQ